MLPPDMTPELATRLEKMITRYVDDPSEYPLEFGLKLLGNCPELDNKPSARTVAGSAQPRLSWKDASWILYQ
jgi:hypothetical protein